MRRGRAGGEPTGLSPGAGRPRGPGPRRCGRPSPGRSRRAGRGGPVTSCRKRAVLDSPLGCRWRPGRSGSVGSGSSARVGSPGSRRPGQRAPADSTSVLRCSTTGRRWAALQLSRDSAGRVAGVMSSTWCRRPGPSTGRPARTAGRTARPGRGVAHADRLGLAQDVTRGQLPQPGPRRWPGRPAARRYGGHAPGRSAIGRCVVHQRPSRAAHGDDQRPLDPGRLAGHGQAEGQQAKIAMPTSRPTASIIAGSRLVLLREDVPVLSGEADHEQPGGQQAEQHGRRGDEPDPRRSRPACVDASTGWTDPN